MGRMVPPECRLDLIEIENGKRASGMTSKPTQDDVDCIASYVEAIAELEAEPFYASDEPRTVSSHGDKHTYRIGDRFYFRSALITFRRIWMKGDAENFDHICNILVKFGTALDKINVQMARGLVRGEINRMVKYPRDLGITAGELINLWLNSVFAHSGLRGREKSRHQFDELVQKHGQGAMEFAFRQSVWIIGLQYSGLAEIARSRLSEWNRQYAIAPSFSLGSAFGTKHKERTKDGDLIIRQSSSKFFSEETYEQRFSRVLARSRFYNLKSALETLGFSTLELLKLVLKYADYSEIVSHSIYDLNVVDHMPDDAAYHHGLRSQMGLYDQKSRATSRLEASYDAVTTDTLGLRMLNEALGELRLQLTAE